MKTALGGQPVIDDSCNKVIIKIAFHPVAERFEVLHPAILEDKVWGFMIVLESSGLSFQRFSLFGIIRRRTRKPVKANNLSCGCNVQG